jgi:hypothetical protein
LKNHHYSWTKWCVHHLLINFLQKWPQNLTSLETLGSWLQILIAATASFILSFKVIFPHNSKNHRYMHLSSVELNGVCCMHHLLINFLQKWPQNLTSLESLGSRLQPLIAATASSFILFFQGPIFP